MPTRAAVVGFPVLHSLSPVMHNAAYAHLKLDWEYAAVEIAPPDFAEKIAELFSDENFKGCNVTMPFKKNAFDFADVLEPAAQSLRNVNTLVKTDQGVWGYSTDGDGFCDSLDGVHFRGLDVLVIGAGGAAHAICDSLVEHGAHVRITARNGSQAQQLRDHVHAMHVDHDHSSQGSISVVDFDQRNGVIAEVKLVVNATPVGMTVDGVVSKETPIDTAAIERHHIVYDTIYHPYETELLAQSRNKGAIVHNGIGMLLYQGARSFTLMTGLEAPVDHMKEALMDELVRREKAGQ